METNSLFSLSIDPVTKDHLSETAKWSRFLAITGMFAIVLMLIFMAFSAIKMTESMRAMEDISPEYNSGPSGYVGVFMALYGVVVAVIWFFPLLYMLRFANRMKWALANNDQQALNDSFQNLKRTMRYVGIVTIIGVVLIALSLVFSIMTMSTLS